MHSYLGVCAVIKMYLQRIVTSRKLLNNVVKMIENDFMLPLRFKTLSNFKKVDDESVEESLCKNIKKDFKDLSAEGYNSLTHSLSYLRHLKHSE